ncbi:hypothetical protein AB7M17_007188 [Bradyrhizobium sp. USDA 377]
MTADQATSDEQASIVEAERADLARPRSDETIYLINADPRTQPKPLPQFVNPFAPTGGPGSHACP